MNFRRQFPGIPALALLTSVGLVWAKPFAPTL